VPLGQLLLLLREPLERQEHLTLNDGEHIDAVADVLGHASIDTTRKHYAFASDARKKATIEVFKV
jgi:hypothetical protein